LLSTGALLNAELGEKLVLGPALGEPDGLDEGLDVDGLDVGLSVRILLVVIPKAMGA
jgi:hypothetical protein